MSRRTLARNAMSGTIQVLLTGAVTFELYRFLIGHLTVSQIGTWSVVLASAATGRLIDFGLGGGVVKFVAKHMGVNARQQAAATIQMAMIGMALLFGLASVFLFPILRSGLAILIKDAASVQQARALLPYALTSLVFGALSGVMLSALDGCQRMDLRALAGTAGSVVQLIGAFCLVPTYGLTGLAVAQVIQSIVVFVLGFGLLFLLIGPDLCRFARWHRSAFKELISYGSGFQAAALGQLLFEPAVKVILTRISGLEFTGYYEMANQLILQLRNILVSAYQSLVPFVAGATHSNAELREIYVASYRLLFFFSCLGFGAVGLMLPSILHVWLGHFVPVFLEIAELCLLGWALNTLTCPAYFMYLGLGELKWPVVSHLTMGPLASGLGILFGFLFGGFGVLGAVTFALVVGSHIVSIAFHRQHKIPLSWLFSGESGAVCICAVVGTLSVLLLSLSAGTSFSMGTNTALLAFAATLAYLSFKNPNVLRALTLLREVRRSRAGTIVQG